MTEPLPDAAITARCRRCGKPLRPDEYPYCDECLAYHQDREGGYAEPDAAITAAESDMLRRFPKADLHSPGTGFAWKDFLPALEAAAPALRAQGAATERAEADLRIADAVATEFCRIRALAKKVGAVYPNPGADRGPLREALKRPPYLPFADLLDADRPEDDAT